MTTSLAVHLHCAQCDAQLGIFENEWVHLTPSYARPKERGINMGCRIGSRTQVVPQGPTQKEAAGCVMVELFCDKCSSIVGQSCKTAPNPEQQHILNQRFFKLSRIYLTDVKDERREDPVFVDSESFDNPSRSTSVRSGLVPKQRAVSRGGFTPSFRQSYPPPSSQTPFYDPYQGPQNMPPPRQSFQQVPPSPVLVHYAPPPSNYSYSHQVSRQSSDVPEPYHPNSASIVPELQQEVKEQGASISGCFNRITTVERRLANEETRGSESERRCINLAEKMHKTEAYAADLGERLQGVEKDCESQNTGLVENREMQTAQERLIAAQAEQIALLTEKLAGFQATIDGLKAQMEDFHSQFLIQRSPRPNSHDFLESMEVMIRAMRSAQAREQEVENLREKNTAMKARLGTIFAAMGSVSEEDTSLLEDPSLSRYAPESPILGKRKRTSDVSEVEQRKLARRIPSTDARDKSLPTPESTQVGKQSSNASQATSTGSEDPLTLQERISLLSDEPQIRTNNSVIQMSVVNQQSTISERADTDTALGRDDQIMNGGTDGEGTTTKTAQEVSQPHPATSDTQQGHAADEDVLQTSGQTVNQLACVQDDVGRFQECSAESFVSPQQGQAWSASRNQHPALTYGRMGSASTMQHPSGNASYVNTPTVPPSRAYSPLHGGSDPRSRSWRRDESNEQGTFSHALSRGHRLEDIIKRPSRPSSAYKSANSSQKDGQEAPAAVQNSVERPLSTDRSGQISMPALGDVPRQDQPTLVHDDSGNRDRHSQMVEFSDEENIAPMGVKPSSTQDKSMMSTTPTGDPRSQQFDRAEVARTIRELTQEPLRRPVIITPSPGAHVNMYRGATPVQQRSILPGFATAIHNLDNSAARHRASTSSRPGESEASSKREWRWKEPVVSILPATSAEQTDTNVKEKVSVAPESRLPNKSPVVAEATPSNHETPQPKPRGRPRKSSTTTRTESSAVKSTSQNDDNCAVCPRGGKLLCCDGCPRSYHYRCANMDSKQPVEGDWFCPQCTSKRDKRKVSSTANVKPQHDDPIMVMRRRLAEEAMARDMARKI